MADQPEDLEIHRAEAEALIEQARWIYEIHAKRTESAQQRATAIIALAGVLLTLAPKALTESDEEWQRSLLVATLVASAATIWLALLVLRPRTTAAPAARQLRLRWAEYRQGKREPGSAMQVAEDLLRSEQLNELSAAEYAKDDADYRIRKLKHAYWSLSLALVLTAALTTVAAFQGDAR